MSDTSEYRSELRTYLLGLGLAAALSAVPFVMVAAHILNRRGCLWAIGGCGVVQVLVHFRCFLHIDLTRQKRDDLQLILVLHVDRIADGERHHLDHGESTRAYGVRRKGQGAALDPLKAEP